MLRIVKLGESIALLNVSVCLVVKIQIAPNWMSLDLPRHSYKNVAEPTVPWVQNVKTSVWFVHGSFRVPER